MKKQNRKLGINQFFDISKFPKNPGIGVYGISMPLIDKKQSPKELFDQQSPLFNKIILPHVGDLIVYSDGLYMNSNESAIKLKHKFQRQIEEHKRGYKKLVEKNIYLIRSAYSFVTWSQLILECPNFQEHFKKIKEIYERDRTLQKYVKLDIQYACKKFNENNVNYILEEILLDYLVSKGKVRLQNDYVQDKEKWILQCYPGKPHRALVYLHKNNLLKIKSDNPYQNSLYDLQKGVLYEFDRMDIETFDFDN